jgi:phosphate starvation-inducible protein PhoH and related proteins
VAATHRGSTRLWKRSPKRFDERFKDGVKEIEWARRASRRQNNYRGYRPISQPSIEDSLELHFDDFRHFTDLVGQRDVNIRTIEQELGVRIGVSGTSLKISGGHAEQALAGKLLSELYEMLKRGYPVYASDVEYSIRILRSDRNVDLKEIFLDTVYVSAHKRVISPKSVNQKLYIDAIRAHDIVFGIGPAGTGKTYLAMAMALSALMKNQVTRMVLCRPAVEAGERLGFLPGDLAEKVNPYLRPLYDALHDMVEFDRARRMLERGTIEVAPLAFMRGRTLNDSFIILDEAQNSTSEQMKMFLTRLGYGSKAVITGDITQIDLPSGKLSGLKEARTVLHNTRGIAFVYFDERDVVRHRLVQAIITAYESASGERTLPQDDDETSQG